LLQHWIWNHISELFVLCKLKSFLFHLECIFYLCIFATICISQVENIVWLNYIALPNIGILHCILYRKTHFFSIVIELIRKVFMNWSYSHGGRNKFSKILIFVWKLRFYHWQQICCCFPWNDRLTGSFFWESGLSKIQVWIIIVCQSFFK
jgi:hypothetical protein